MGISAQKKAISESDIAFLFGTYLVFKIKRRNDLDFQADKNLGMGA